ncbi:MAG TPA: cytochrome d ubiquinol oxidase subunit II [Burkholderiales bacterium]|jgi:cytochrome d ubiquinol oxidase subunit II
MDTWTQPSFWLPLVFLFLMGVAMLAYVLLDGYDLGVGILLRRVTDPDRDRMIAAIGPFWDANETWLVLGVGILLTAFPIAHGAILGALYLPVALMLAGLILRGVAFDFRVKAHAHHKPWWDRAFYFGSVLATFAQGVMLGSLVTGFTHGWPETLFSLFIGLCLIAGYALLGSCWLIYKTEGALQLRAVRWAHTCLWLTGVGIASVSIATPWVSQRIYDKWFTLPNFLYLAPIPLLSAALFFTLETHLRHLPQRLAEQRPGRDWAPYVMAAGLFFLAFLGLAYSLFPFLIVDRLTIWQAASAPESMLVIFYGACVVLPAIVGYTIYAYRVFSGKATALSYD